MVQPARAATVFAAALALGAAALFIAVVGVPPEEQGPSALLTEDRSPLVIADLDGEPPQFHLATWEGQPVIVLKLAGPVAGASAPVPGEPGNVLVVFSAKSTHMGCRVEPIDDPAFGLVLRDICHHGAWDPTAGAEVVRAPAPAPLPQFAPHLERLPRGAVAIHATGPST